MKIKSYILCVILIATALNSQAKPLTNDVPLGEALTFSLRTIKDWHPNLQFESDELLYYSLSNNYFTSLDATNFIPVKFLQFPYPQAFDFHLFDDRGNEVRKTIKGWYYTGKTKIPKDCDDMVEGSVIGSDSRALMRPSDMFAIKNAGTYELEVRMKICVPLTTNGLPDTKAMTTWRDPHVSTTNPHERNTNLGILISDPVRVKIVKQ